METIADRLTQAAEGFAGGRKAFQRAMRARLGGGDGTSYPAVLGYFAGSTSPSVAWLDAAAELLGVRSAWLALGLGAPSEEEERERLFVGKLAELQEEESREFTAAFMRAMRSPSDYEPRHWTPTAMMLARRLGLEAKGLGVAVAAPLAALGVDAGRMTGESLDDHIVRMLVVLIALQGEREAQAPYRMTKEED